MLYSKMDNKELARLLRLRAPGMPIHEVNEENRSTVIAFLRMSDWMDLTTTEDPRSSTRVA